MEPVLIWFRKIPFTCSYFPGKTSMAVMAALYLAGFTTYSWSMADLEARPAAGTAEVIALAALHRLAGDDASRIYQKLDSPPPRAGSSASDYALAIAALHEHRYDDAELSLQRWLTAHAADRKAQYELASARREIARSQLRHLLAIAPDSYHVHQMLGRLYASRDDDDRGEPGQASAAAEGSTVHRQSALV